MGNATPEKAVEQIGRPNHSTLFQHFGLIPVHSTSGLLDIVKLYIRGPATNEGEDH